MKNEAKNLNTFYESEYKLARKHKLSFGTTELILFLCFN